MTRIYRATYAIILTFAVAVAAYSAVNRLFDIFAEGDADVITAEGDCDPEIGVLSDGTTIILLAEGCE